MQARVLWTGRWEEAGYGCGAAQPAMEQDNGVGDMPNTRVALSKQQHQQGFGGYSFNLLLLKTIQNLTKISEY